MTSMDGPGPIELTIESPLWDPFDWGGLACRVRAACAARVPDLAGSAEISLLLCDDRSIASYNDQWRGVDRPTNVLSFPASGPARDECLGDIVMAYETMAREAEQEGKALTAHFAHLAAHGMLHLVGYDHGGDVEAERMETLETAILNDLGLADPYAGSCADPDAKIGFDSRRPL